MPPASASVPALAELRLGAPWVLRPLAGAAPTEPPGRTARTYAVTPVDGGPVILLDLHRVADHPLRACYPYGAHDVAVGLVPPGPAEDGRAPAGPGPRPAARLLRDLAPALFAADPRCRRVIAAPDVDDTAFQHALEDGGFQRVTEADLPGGSVVLFAAEPPEVAHLSTALDDMPH